MSLCFCIVMASELTTELAADDRQMCADDTDLWSN